MMDPLGLVEQLLPPLLHLYWILAAGAVIVTLLPSPLPQAFKDAVRLSAARGKLWQDRPKSLGRLNDMSVPQSWFLHFYVIGAACCVALTLACGLQLGAHDAGSSDVQEACQYLALWLFSAHLIRRLLETRFMLVYPAGARMHLIAYLFGCSYYIVAPLSLLPNSPWRWWPVWQQQQHVQPGSAHQAIQPQWVFHTLNSLMQHAMPSHASQAVHSVASAGLAASSVVASSSAEADEGFLDTLADFAQDVGDAVADHAAYAAGALSEGFVQLTDVVADSAGHVAHVATLVGAVANAVAGPAGGAGVAAVVGAVASGVSSVAGTADTVADTVQDTITAVNAVLDVWPDDNDTAAAAAAAAEEEAAWWARGPLQLLQAAVQDAPRRLSACVHTLLEHHSLTALLGVCIMLLGFIVQFHSHLLLARLASTASKQQPASKQPQPQRQQGPQQQQRQQDASDDVQYSIPQGGLFHWVSCPHYLGEVLIYLGLAVLCWPQLLPQLMLCWVVVNLVLAACATQAWYLQRFPATYPRHRKALVPFLL